MVGTVISNYRILEKLGEGGMGVVYKAVDVNLDRTVAIKALTTELTGNPELEQRFRAEARAQANLNHTNLATLYALLIEEGRPWMVMEFIEGENFEQIIQRRGPIPSQEAIPLFRQALLGLGYAHRMGIIHRDIKPSNLMVNRQGIVKVMDFGIAKVLGARGMTRAGMQMGTAFYMSPEQVLNKGVDIRSDIYSLGVTLYEMLTANVPFSGDTDYKIMTDHVNTPPPLLTRFYPYIPQGVEAAVMKAIAKNPDSRFQTVEEFGAALEHPGEIAVPAPRAIPIAAGGVVMGAGFGSPAPPPVPAYTAAPARAAFGPLEKKLAIGGAALIVLIAAGWAAMAPKPKSSGLGAPAHQNSGGIPLSSGGDLRVLPTPITPQPAATPAETEKAAPASNPPQDSETATSATSATSAASAPAPFTIIPVGTPITVRMIDSVDSSRDRAGQRFAASIDLPVLVHGRPVLARGAAARVLLAGVSQAGHIEGRNDVRLELVSVSVHGVSHPVRSTLYEQQGASRGKVSGAVIGGGAAVGAAIGGIFGHKRGAVEGAAAGAGAGTASRYATKNAPIVIPPETRIQFTLRTPVVLTP